MKFNSIPKAAALLCLSLVLSLLSGIIFKVASCSAEAASCAAMTSAMSCCASGDCVEMKDCGCSIQPAQPTVIPVAAGDRAIQTLKMALKQPTCMQGNLSLVELIAGRFDADVSNARLKPDKIYILKRSFLI